MIANAFSVGEFAKLTELCYNNLSARVAELVYAHV